MVTVATALKLEPPRWGTAYGSEEAALVASLPTSPRLRRLVSDLEHVTMAEGFLHLNTDDLARRLRCSKATLYRLAPGRDQLLELIVELWLSRLRDLGWRNLEAADDWSGKLIGYLQAVKEGTRDVSQRFIEDLRAFPAGYRILMDHQRRRINVVEAIVVNGVEAGEFQPVHPALAADLLLTTVRRIVEPAFLSSVGLSLADAFDEWYRILEFGLIKPRGSRRKARS